MLLITIMNIIIDLYIIFFLLKLALPRRDFTFNPLLNPIDKATEPALLPIRKALLAIGFKRDISPIMAILVLVLIRGGFYALAMKTPVVSAIRMSLLGTITFLFQAVVVMAIITMLVPRWSGNPIVNFCYRVVEQPIRLTESLIAFYRKAAPLLFIILLFLCYYIIVFLMSFELPYSSLRNPIGMDSAKTIFYQSFTRLTAITTFFVVVIIIRALMSWFSPDYRNPLVSALIQITDPILVPFRRIIPLIGGIDISPIFAIIVIGYLGSFLNELMRYILFGWP